MFGPRFTKYLALILFTHKNVPTHSLRVTRLLIPIILLKATLDASQFKSRLFFFSSVHCIVSFRFLFLAFFFYILDLMQAHITSLCATESNTIQIAVHTFVVLFHICNYHCEVKLTVFIRVTNPTKRWQAKMSLTLISWFPSYPLLESVNIICNKCTFPL